MRLDRYFERGLFAPLGMADTTYAPTPGQAARQAAVFRRGADGSLARIERNLPADREFLSGGGTMYSTAPDYLAFLRMLLDDGRAPDGTAVLPPGTVARMAESRTAGMRVSCLDPAMPEMSNAIELLPGVRKAWGLGTMVTLDDIPGARRAGSLAWGGLGNTYYWADPAAGVGGVLLTQVLPFADPAVLRLFDAFERAVYAAA